eukprot:5689765-Prymnesium_polylepis.1
MQRRRRKRRKQSHGRPPRPTCPPGNKNTHPLSPRLPVPHPSRPHIHPVSHERSDSPRPDRRRRTAAAHAELCGTSSRRRQANSRHVPSECWMLGSL